MAIRDYGVYFMGPDGTSGSVSSFIARATNFRDRGAADSKHLGKKFVSRRDVVAFGAIVGNIGSEDRMTMRSW
jgi:hypothetical protein